MPARLRRLLLCLHRWITLALAPLFLVIILSGGLLALEPVVRDLAASPGAEEPIPLAELQRFLAEVDPQQRTRALTLEQGGTAVLELSRAGERWHEAFDLEQRTSLGERAYGGAFFQTVRHLHKDLMLDLAVVVEVASYALILVLIAGPWLAWPRLRHSLTQWHTLIGWLTLPLLLLVSITGVLMALELGTPRLPPVDRDAGRLAVGPVLQQLEATETTHVYRMERFERAAWTVEVDGTAGHRQLIVTAEGITPVDAYPGWVAELHQGTWAGPWSGLINLLAALALLFLFISGVWLWARRWLGGRRRGDADADLLIAYASQTGTAAQLAAETARALRSGGARIEEAALSALEPKALDGYRYTLLIVSTCGDGDMPDTGRTFLAALESSSLNRTRFALLALGDSSYRHFCAAGESLRTSLRRAGAEEVLPMARADGAPEATWQLWLGEVAELVGVQPGQTKPIPADQPLQLTLRRREQLNDPNDPITQEVWGLTLESDTPLTYRPGDLLLVRPGEGEPARPYSIGSTPLDAPHRLELTVAVTSRTDARGKNRPGKASSLLAQRLQLGETIATSLRTHRHMHPPDDPQQPIILIAAGCGIAPFIGFVAERAAQSQRGPVWLIFGNRRRHGDFFHAERLQRWQAQGVLTRLDLAFSRDPEDGGYVQDRIADARAMLVDWMLHRNARIYACGRRSTIGTAVPTALTEALRQCGAPAYRDQAEAVVRGWQSDGRLRLDVID
ncbi:PepSY domain-containing protein [Halorhodospira halophila]|uniref:Flavodoxin/nitric oxide synthase n=1 Tax=Halorhodospira halophila (strain DSM 244 / SL1) TaxID=349124 RepID=A1WTG9_HALHL|nr:PepSY domain-containing protein [Halorhodospira halophila]ABM60981.1 flavodoxin/nitric oxide synthase [Halorhodospira halophila SL1]MBK1728639.1 nitric oxide synthase [Halorhodospira halophila]